MRRLLVSAYACEPGKGSEQGVGWNWVREMSRTEQLWVITRTNNRTLIEDSMPSDMRASTRFVYVDLPRRYRRWKRKERGLYVYYALWQLAAYREARRLADSVAFDYCVHLTFGNMWLPTLMYRLDIPFIWGPLGGGESVPPPFISMLPWRDMLAQWFRRVLLRCQRVNPLLTGPAGAATAIIARTCDTKSALGKRFRDKTVVMLETAMDQELLTSADRASGRHGERPVTFVYVGRLVAFKAVELGVRAFARMTREKDPVKLKIIGDGPLRDSLGRLAQRLGVAELVSFVGALPRSDALRELVESDVFLFPSLREGGVWSLMEAMSLGLPVVCINTSGMKIITDDTCAIRVSPTSPERVVVEMADAMTKLAQSPELREAMGANARRRISEMFMWAQKGVFMRELLERLDQEGAIEATQ